MGSESGDGSADRNRGWSPDRNRGWGLGGNGGWSPDRNRGWGLGGNGGWSPDRGRRSQSEETGDHSNRSPHTSPARYESLWRLGRDPQEWSDPLASTSGTSLSETERLSKMQAVKAWAERGTWKVFENTLAQCLPEELATAKSLGVKPMHADDPGFEDVANGGTINWAVTQSGDLLFVPQYVAHPVLTQGGPVIAAGEALIAVDGNERFCTDITNQSGHYRPDERSLEIGKQAFKVFGMTFLGETKESDDGNGDGNIGGHDGHNYNRDGDSDADARELNDARKEFLDVLNAFTNKRLAEEERAKRLEELAKDPAQGGTADQKTRREAEVALQLEEVGKLAGPIIRDPSGCAEFIDRKGTLWDVKQFHSEKGRFNLGGAVKTIRKEILAGENVILDTKFLDSNDVAALRSAIEANGWQRRVLWSQDDGSSGTA